MAASLTVSDTMPSGGSATGNPRNKVELKKGRGLMDWVKLGRTEEDLAGTGGKHLKVTYEELAKHNKREDAWIALKGQVFNITSYFEYHPGGEDELMRGAGIDATDLFNEVHKWVNFTSMLSKCLVGTLMSSSETFGKPAFLPLKRLGKVFNSKKEGQAELIDQYYNDSVKPVPKSDKLLSLPKGPSKLVSLKKSAGPKSPSDSKGGLFSSFTIPLPCSVTPQELPAPKYDWFQTKTLINIAIYTKWKDMDRTRIVVANRKEGLKILTYIRNNIYTIHLKLHKEVEEKIEVKCGKSGKTDVLLTKKTEGRWSTVGKPLEHNNDFEKASDQEIEYVQCTVAEKIHLTHNTYIFSLEVPDNIYINVPIGFHVYLQLLENDLVKPFTPIVTNFTENFMDQNTYIELFVKIYSDGFFTPSLAQHKKGSELLVSFPQGTFTQEMVVRATVEPSHLVLLAAGTGITPMIKLLLEALKNEVKTLLISFNKTEEDIPWREELEKLCTDNPKLLRVHNVLSAPSKAWKSHSGHISFDLLDRLLPISDGEKAAFICVCGPKPFNKLTMSLLDELGYLPEAIHLFEG